MIESLERVGMCDYRIWHKSRYAGKKKRNFILKQLLGTIYLRILLTENTEFLADNFKFKPDSETLCLS